MLWGTNGNDWGSLGEKLLQTAHDAIVVVNERGEITLTNHQVERWFQYAPGELIGQPVEILIPERFRRSHVRLRTEYTRQATARPMVAKLDLFARRKDGSEFPVDIALTPIEMGGKTFVSAIIRDCSERKRIEAKERFVSETSRILTETIDYQDRVQKIAELVVPTLADACVAFTYEDGQLRPSSVVHVDPKMQEYLREMAVRNPPVSGAPYGSAAAVRTSAPQLVEEVTEEVLGQIAKNDEHLNQVRKLGMRSFISVPMAARGRVIGAISLIITRPGRKFSAEDLEFAKLVATRAAMAVDNARLYRDALRATRAREDVLAVVSHDLKSPLTAILAGSSLLSRICRPDVPGQESFSQVADGIQRSAKQMESLISNLLDSAKIDAGAFSVDKKEAFISPLIHNCVELFRPIASEKKIEIVERVEPRLPTLKMDPDRVGQVLTNLVGNAVKFTPRSGRVTVQAKARDTGILVSVEDTGRGISKEELPHIFDRYWQVKETAKHGTGLGLTIVKGIIDAHHGTVWVESTPGLGSRFLFMLPFQG